MSKTDDAIIAERKKILEGYMLCIDPSTGSHSSMPGYAIYKQGKFVESGTVQVSPSLPRNRRLYEIRRTFEHDFDVPDIIAVEHISSVPFGPINHDALAGLLRGVGAILSAFDISSIVEIPPKVWKTTVDAAYIKTDESDAVYIGRYAILTALGEEYVQRAKSERPKVVSSSSTVARPKRARKPNTRRK